MKAMLLTAGLGTRLRPMTNHIPKPLVPVDGIPLIFYNLALLKKYGVKDVVINLHHLGNQIRKLLGSGKKFGFRFKYSTEPKILGTGGGIKKAEKILKNGPFIVLNGDIIIDINLAKLMAFYRRRKPLAVLVVRGRPPKGLGRLHVDSKNRIVSILEKPDGGNCMPTFFTGFHVLDGRFFSTQKAGKKSCIIRDGYIPLLKKGKAIHAFVHKGGYWNDLGTMDRLEDTEKKFRKGVIHLSFKKELETFRKILNRR